MEFVRGLDDMAVAHYTSRMSGESSDDRIRTHQASRADGSGCHECAVAALDIGTTSIKAAVVGQSGRVMSVAERRQTIVADGPGWREHVTARVLRDTIAALTEAVAAYDRPNPICSIAVTGSSGSFAILDDHDRPLTNVLTWQDRRSDNWTPRPKIDPETYYRITGTPLDPAVALSRVMWLRRHRRGIVSGSHRLATPQGLVVLRLGGTTPPIEPSVASLVGLLDLESRDWSSELLDCFEMTPEMLPPIVTTGSIVGTLAPRVAENVGLRPGLDLVLAATDGVCAQLGAGVVEEGLLYAYLGSALAVSGPTRRPLRDPGQHLVIAPSFGPGWWRIVGLGMAGSSAIDWLAHATGRSVLRDLEDSIAQTRPGAGGVLFLPSLAGAAAPLWDRKARGAFLGLSFSTRRRDMVRACLEGVALELRWTLDAVRRVGGDVKEIRLTGGGTRSRGWCQIVASAIDLPALRLTEPHPGLRGAAFYAIAAHTGAPSVEAVAALRPPETEVVDGDAAQRPIYDELADVYREAQSVISKSTIGGRLARATARTSRP